MVNFQHREDGVIEIALGQPYDGFTHALNDSISTRPPKGDPSHTPSTYWIDRVLDAVRDAGPDNELSSGNATRIVMRGAEVTASSDYESFEAETMPLPQFINALELWKAEVLDALDAAT